MARLAGKCAIVTGGSKGIESGIATALASEGARVAVNYSTDRSGAERVAEQIKRAGGDAVIVGADVSKAADVRRLFTEVEAAFGGVDVLVNNAGIFRFGPFVDVTAEAFHAHYSINVLGSILTIQEAIKRFGAHGGSIINISSIVASHPVAGVVLYASTMGAIETLTKGLALELAPRNIRVNGYRNRRDSHGWNFRRCRGCCAGREDTARATRTRHRYRAAGGVSGIRRVGLDHRGGHSRRRWHRRRGLIHRTTTSFVRGR